MFNPIYTYLYVYTYVHAYTYLVKRTHPVNPQLEWAD